MAVEQLKAQIGLLLSEINREPEDLHELYEEIHQKLNELRATAGSIRALSRSASIQPVFERSERLEVARRYLPWTRRGKRLHP